MNPVNEEPTLSIVIPCYNQGRFLGKALQSCRELGHPGLEIIVVDDSSTDETQEVACNQPGVRYVRQENKGLASARNTGLRMAKGRYVSFLDADDWYLPNNLLVNLDIIHRHPHYAYIAGCHEVHFENGDVHVHCMMPDRDVFRFLLLTNFIGNPSTVVYRRSLLRDHPFSQDARLKGCEDYDHYLTLARNYPVLHNPIPVSAYRKHGSNMSNNHTLMLCAALAVLLKHKVSLRDRDDQRNWSEGWNRWLRYYGFFPLTYNKKKTLTRHHLRLAKTLGFALPLVLLKKIAFTLGNTIASSNPKPLLTEKLFSNFENEA